MFSQFAAGFSKQNNGVLYYKFMHRYINQVHSATSCFDGPKENTYLAMSSRSCRVFILWIIPIICYLSSPILALFSPSTHSFSSNFMELQTISDVPYSFFRTQIFVFVLFIIGKFPLYVLQGIPQSAFLRSLSVQCRNMFNSCLTVADIIDTQIVKLVHRAGFQVHLT